MKRIAFLLTVFCTVSFLSGCNCGTPPLISFGDDPKKKVTKDGSTSQDAGTTDTTSPDGGQDDGPTTIPRKKKDGAENPDGGAGDSSSSENTPDGGTKEGSPSENPPEGNPSERQPDSTSPEKCTPGSESPCGTPTGECKVGKKVCQADGTWGPCIGEVKPKAEVCDNLDNNCDGAIDEGLKCAPACKTGEQRPCGHPFGACGKQFGIQLCTEGQWSQCQGNKKPSKEICGDNIDNDCNGTVDETCSGCTPGESRSCGTDTLGACKTTAMQKCLPNGSWGVCPLVKQPSSEKCDDLIDNNCDGSINEGCTCSNGQTQPCTNQIGECKKAIQVCLNSRWTRCFPQPTKEVCDQKDNDCDGKVDEDLPNCNKPPKPDGNPGENPNPDGGNGKENPTDTSIPDGGTNEGGSPDGAPPEGPSADGGTMDNNAKDGTPGNDRNPDTNNPDGGTTPDKPKCIPKPEVCNGKDDDCDNQIDEGIAPKACTKGQGACFTRGQATCQNGQFVCNAPLIAPQPEVCNGKDDDCDGKVDNNLVIKACSNGKGECFRLGLTTCTNGKPGCSAPVVTPKPELCNGKDDDCDGRVDETFTNLGKDCFAGANRCRQKGKFICNSAGGVTCTAKALPATPEVCNGIDDDCDGQTDETFPEKGKACNNGLKGSCLRNGTFVCLSGKVTCKLSSPTPSPRPEICDQQDNDCDGFIDEGLTGCCVPGTTQQCLKNANTRPGVGICKAGNQTCQSNRTWGTCTGEVTARTEVCNNLDDDCDGLIDETFPLKGKTCERTFGVVCKTKGVFICRANILFCNAPAISIAPETCNGKDDDCDGLTDEGIPTCCTPGTTRNCTTTGNRPGIGLCKAGTQTCTATRSWGACQSEIKPSTEKCNGKDDDCDGQTDENFTDLNTTCSAGVGECRSPGKRVCNPAQTGTICNAKPKTATPEKCNGKDDDCDGQTDEGFAKGVACTVGVGECRSTGVNVCKADGTGITCNATPKASKPEVCNNKDDDCDGRVDDGLNCTTPDGNTPDGGTPDGGSNPDGPTPENTPDSFIVPTQPFKAGAEDVQGNKAINNGKQLQVWLYPCTQLADLEGSGQAKDQVLSCTNNTTIPVCGSSDKDKDGRQVGIFQYVFRHPTSKKILAVSCVDSCPCLANGLTFKTNGKCNQVGGTGLCTTLQSKNSDSDINGDVCDPNRLNPRSFVSTKDMMNSSVCSGGGSTGSTSQPLTASESNKTTPQMGMGCSTMTTPTHLPFIPLIALTILLLGRIRRR